MSLELQLVQPVDETLHVEDNRRTLMDFLDWVIRGAGQNVSNFHNQRELVVLALLLRVQIIE